MRNEVKAWGVCWHGKNHLLWAEAYAYKSEAIKSMLSVFFTPDEYDTAQKKRNCVRKANRKGLMVVKIRLEIVTS